MKKSHSLVAFSLLLFCSISRGTEPKRPIPNLLGRKSTPQSLGRSLLWVPRVLLFPAYLVSEYVIRWPLNSLGSYAERHQLPSQIASLFTFGEAQQYVLYPTVLIDFGFRPSVGLHFVAKDTPWQNHKLNVNAAYGGSRYYVAGFKDTIVSSPTTTGILTFDFNHRPDLIFHGLGPMSEETHKSRYNQRKIEGTVGMSSRLQKNLKLRSEIGLRNAEFSDGNSLGDPGIESRITAGVYPAPSGFRSGYTSFRQELELSFGDRVGRAVESFGFRSSLKGEHAFSLKEKFSSGWLLYGGALTGFVALDRRFRVLSLTLDGRLAHFTNAANGSIPFTELPRLGGSRPLIGFREGRLLGESSAVATLEYRWPVWSFADGFTNFEIGNVFGSEFKSFRTGALRKSLGLGIKSVTEADSEQSFTLTAALGSKPFEQSGAYDEFRLLIGVTRAF